MKKKVIYSWLLLLFFIRVFTLAQPLPISSNYTINKFSLSPACAGLHNNFKSIMTYRQNWMGIQGAPEYTMIFIDGAIFENAGYGLQLSSEKSGIFKDLAFGGTYAYHVLLDKEQYLSFGFTGEYYKNEIDFGSIKVYDPSDIIIVSRQFTSASAFNSSFGANYKHNDLNTGIAINNLFKNQLNNNDVIYTSYRQYKIYTAYKYNLSIYKSIEPILVVYKNSNTPVNYEIGANYNYTGEFWGGIIYRNNINFAISAGVNLYGNFIINYAYEFSPVLMQGKTLGSHEISLGFMVDKDKRFSIEYIKAKRKHFKASVKKIFKRNKL